MKNGFNLLAENLKKNSQRLVVWAIAIGGSLEWYEIGLFIFWPLIIDESAAGFDVSLAETLNSGAIFFITFLALSSGLGRAIGGWFFGKIGDEKGRKEAFSLSVLIATIPSWSLAILSFFVSYDTWLTYSTVVFALVKFFQGMPAGGEVPGAICYLAETGTNARSKRYLCSYALLGPQIGLGCSTGVCLFLKMYFAKSVIKGYAWRYVFILSGIAGILGYLMRQKIHETTKYLNFTTTHKVHHGVAQELFSQYFFRVVLAIVLSTFQVISFSVVSVVPYFYANAPFNLGKTAIALMSIGFFMLCGSLLPCAGKLAGRFMNVSWMKISAFGLIFSSFFLFFALSQGHLFLSIFLSFINVLFLTIHSAILPSILAEIFPLSVRYTGIAFSFNICDGILWATFTGIGFLCLPSNSLVFILLIPFASLIFFAGVRFGKYSKKMAEIIK